MLIFELIQPVNAISILSLNKEVTLQRSSGSALLGQESLLKLQEASPPGAVLQIREGLSKHHPKLNIESPVPGALIDQENWELVMNLDDWPLVDDADLGIGPHVVIQLDDLPPMRITKAEDNQIRVPMKALTPGSHRIASYLAYPWGESIKEHGSSSQSRIHFLQKLDSHPEVSLEIVSDPLRRPPTRSLFAAHRKLYHLWGRLVVGGGLLILL